MCMYTPPPILFPQFTRGCPPRHAFSGGVRPTSTIPAMCAPPQFMRCAPRSSPHDNQYLSRQLVIDIESA